LSTRSIFTLNIHPVLGLKGIAMKTTAGLASKVGAFLLAVATFAPASARADTYSWTNFQSDIAGVAQHVDPNLANPCGMAASPNGVIWISDNGTGVSTLYNQDGTPVRWSWRFPRPSKTEERRIRRAWSSTAHRSSA